MDAPLETLNITIDYQTLNEYNRYYFAKYPRRKKRPIDRPIHESLNIWTGLQSLARNNLKQNWKEFIQWLVDKKHLNNYQVEFCDVRFEMFMPSRRRADNDNFVPKFILDGFVESGFLIDDDSKHLNDLTLHCDYDKDNPRTEITFYIYKRRQYE